jgi:hypothetical protein
VPLSLKDPTTTNAKGHVMGVNVSTSVSTAAEPATNAVLVTYTDPTPPAEEAVQAVKAEHAAIINAYYREERKYHEEADEIPIHFWYDFTMLFRLENLAYQSPREAKG